MEEKIDAIVTSLAQMNPEQLRTVMGVVAFSVFFILTLVFGFFGAIIVGLILMAVLIFADGEYHWSDRLFQKRKA